MTEQTIPPRQPDATPATEPQPAKELLDVENFGGLYGRMLLSTQLDGADSIKYLNPNEQVTTILPLFEENRIRNYNFITEKISKTERKEAWGDKNLGEAYKEWRVKFTDAINSTGNENRKKVISALLSEDIETITLEYTDDIYDELCKSNSNTTLFVNVITDSLKKDGKVDEEKVKTLMPEIKWVASKLFGNQSAEIVARILELETSIKNKGNDAATKVYDKARINKLEKYEIELLKAVLLIGPDDELKPAPNAQAEAEKDDIETAREELAALVPPADDASEEDKKQFEDKKNELLKRAKLKFGPAILIGYGIREEDIVITGLLPKNSYGEYYFTAVKRIADGSVLIIPGGVPIDRVKYPEEKPTGSAQTAGEGESEQQPGQEKEPITLVFAKEKGITGLADEMVESLDNHLDDQRVDFKMSIDVLPHFLPLIMKDQLKNPDNPGEVDIGLGNIPIIKGVELKNGNLLKVFVNNSKDGKGIELTIEGEAGNEIIEASPHFNDAIVQLFNTVIKQTLTRGEIHRIKFEGEGKDTILIIEAIPGGEKIDIPDIQEPVQPDTAHEIPSDTLDKQDTSI